MLAGDIHVISKLKPFVTTATTEQHFLIMQTEQIS
jgi:hypothetical protein